jgi:hypothetical protein
MYSIFAFAFGTTMYLAWRKNPFYKYRIFANFSAVCAMIALLLLLLDFIYRSSH